MSCKRIRITTALLVNSTTIALPPNQLLGQQLNAALLVPPDKLDCTTTCAKVIMNSANHSAELDSDASDSKGPQSAEIPQTFLAYVKSFGPGIVVVLTWLGAGDIVEIGVAGGNFGYALMWVVVLAIVMALRFALFTAH